MLQLKKNQDILHSTCDEALFCCSGLREIPASFLSLKRVPDTLYATQEFPQNTHLHWRGTLSVPPPLKKSPFSPPHIKIGVHSLASSGKESRRSCHTSRGGRSHHETREELQGSCHNSKRPRCPHPLEIRPDSPATARMEPRISLHNTKGGLRVPSHL